MATCRLGPADDKIEILYIKREEGSQVKYCGYKRDYFEDLSKMEEEFICKKCQGIICKPSISNNEVTCLVCSDTPDQLNAVQLVENCINKLEIRCPLLRNCGWKGKLSEADTHTSNCEHFLIECSQCRLVLQRGKMEIHNQKFCLYRMIACEYCKKKFKVKDLEIHLKYCSLYPINCPNKCGSVFPRIGLSDHNSECPLAEVECPYTRYGCKSKPMKRRDLLSHKKEFVIEHIDMGIGGLQNEKSILKKELEEVKCKLKIMKCLDGVEWDLKNLDQLNQGDRIEGPTFYVDKYYLQAYFHVLTITKLRLYELKFYLKRIQGQHDNLLGNASITKCCFILVDTKAYTNSNFDDLEMNYDLVKDGESKAFHTLWISPKDTLVRMYFEVNANLQQ